MQYVPQITFFQIHAYLCAMLVLHLVKLRQPFWFKFYFQN